MSAHDVAADAIGSSELVDTNELTRRIVAARVLDALREAGFAVVELPKPVGFNGSDNAVWLSSPYIEQEFNGDVVIADRLGFDVDELPSIAAALLAAHVKWVTA